MRDGEQRAETRLDIVHAQLADVPEMERLITASAQTLSRGFYSDREIEAAIAHVFGVDSELVRDGTYFAVKHEETIIGCGGWSRRRTLFGGDRFAARESALLDPASEPARIRAFFVSSAHARRGVASALLAACEAAAVDAGFTHMVLMATLPGEPFYARHGYVAEQSIAYDCGGVAVRFIRMSRALLQK